jgi:hypothetical protein
VLVHGGVDEFREGLSACLRLCCRCGIFVRLQASTNNVLECAMFRGSLCVAYIRFGDKSCEIVVRRVHLKVTLHSVRGSCGVHGQM